MESVEVDPIIPSNSPSVQVGDLYRCCLHCLFQQVVVLRSVDDSEIVDGVTPQDLSEIQIGLFPRQFSFL